MPISGEERARKNIEEGRGVSIGSAMKGIRRGTTYEFSTANPMWRATMEKLSFAPLSVVDYGGGIIITDWFSDDGNEEEIKIAVRFLTNEIRSDAIKVIIHKKKCITFNNCKITSIENTTNSEIKLAILKEAALIQKKDLAKTREENTDVKLPKNF